jgi:peroxiredoxin/uncharacterized membrane protein YphA (DoxX/SURF4 family)
MRKKVGIVLAVLLGLTFIASGSGKILGMEQTPAQIIDFISSLIPEAILTPVLVSFLYDIFIPYVLPWAELILGLLLVFGFFPRLVAAICLPLIAALMGSNIFAINQGSYTTCASCFGIWERALGSLSPTQALVIDIVLMLFAIGIIVILPVKFLSGGSWLGNLARGDDKWSSPTLRKIRSLFDKLAVQVVLHPHRTIFIAIGLIALSLVSAGIWSYDTGRQMANKTVPDVSHVAVSSTSENGAVITFDTKEKKTGNVIVYGADGLKVGSWSDNTTGTSHTVSITGLVPGRSYSFIVTAGGKVSSADVNGIFALSTRPVDKTPPVISAIGVTSITESSAAVVWATDKPATSEIEYWVLGSKDTKTVVQKELTSQHKVPLDSLAPNVAYQFRITATDSKGNSGVSAQDGSFSLVADAKAGYRAPNFTLSLLGGEQVSLRDYEGRVVLLTFWTSSCSICQKKLPIIDEVFSKMPANKVAFLNVHVRGRDSIISAYLQNEKLSLPVLFDEQGIVSQLYGVTGVPKNFLIGADGMIRAVDVEFTTSAQLLNLMNGVITQSAINAGCGT